MPAGRPHARPNSRAQGKEDGAPRTPAGLERYYLFGSVVFLKDGRSECGRGKPCVSRARGVSSGGAGGVPPAFYADGTGFFFFFF